MATACLDTEMEGLVISKFWFTIRAWPAFGVARVQLNVSHVDNVQPRSSNQNDVLPCHTATFTYVTEIINAPIEIGWCKRIAAQCGKGRQPRVAVQIKYVCRRRTVPVWQP